MKKRIGLTLAIGLVASLASMHAAIIPCADTTLNVLIALGSGPGNGCSVADTLFNNFSYSPSNQAPGASEVVALLDENVPTLTFGWIFSSGARGFRGNFTLGYTVAVITAGLGACPTCTITSAEEQMFPGTPPPDNQSILVNEGVGSPMFVTLTNLTLAGRTGGNLISPGVLTLTKTATSSGIKQPNPLLSFESDVGETNTPEPVTLSLMGISLLGLSLIGRRSYGQRIRSV